MRFVIRSFFPVPAYKSINDQIKTRLTEDGCGEGPEEDVFGYDTMRDYQAVAYVVALNSTYVGIRVESSQGCGGAHPNEVTYYMTFDSRTGALLDIAHQFGFQVIQYYNNPDFDREKEKEEAQQKKVAAVLLSHIPKDLECFQGITPEDITPEDITPEDMEEMMSLFPLVEGLAKDKKVVLGVSPAHIANACRFDVRVGYDAVKEMIIPGSYLHQWLTKGKSTQQ